MIVIRPIERKDLPVYVKLAHESHINFYTLPKDMRLLEYKLERSLDSFKSEVSNPDREYYLFAAEDKETHALIGVGAIQATTGGNEPLYFYRQEYSTVESKLEQVTKRLPILNPISYVRGPSEVASLFVLPQHRKTGAGKLLSLSRFLFMARFPERITGSIIAELRGPLENNTSRFWEGIGRHFFNIPFHEVLEMLKFGRSFIGEFLPKNPIYVDLLSYKVQQVIGEVDTSTLGALSMLLRLGFDTTDEIDVIDGGPKLRGFKESISAICKSQVVKVHKIEEHIDAPTEYIVSNERIDFRACYAKVAFEDGQRCEISREVATNLEVGIGDHIRIFDYMTHMSHIKEA